MNLGAEICSGRKVGMLLVLTPEGTTTMDSNEILTCHLAIRRTKQEKDWRARKSTRFVSLCNHPSNADQSPQRLVGVVPLYAKERQGSVKTRVSLTFPGKRHVAFHINVLATFRRWVHHDIKEPNTAEGMQRSSMSLAVIAFMMLKPK